MYLYIYLIYKVVSLNLSVCLSVCLFMMHGHSFEAIDLKPSQEGWSGPRLGHGGVGPPPNLWGRGRVQKTPKFGLLLTQKAPNTSPNGF